MTPVTKGQKREYIAKQLEGCSGEADAKTRSYFEERGDFKALTLMDNEKRVLAAILEDYQ